MEEAGRTTIRRRERSHWPGVPPAENARSCEQQQPQHPTIIDEAMESNVVPDDAPAEAATCSCDNLQIQEPTLTQMIEEGLEDAGKDSDNDLM